MKKILILILCLGAVIVVYCSIPNIKFLHLANTTQNEKQISQTTIENIVSAIKNNDSETLKQLFSKSTIETVEDLDTQIENLFNLYGCQSFKETRFAGSMVDETNDGFKEQTCSFDVVGESGDFLFVIKLVMQDKNEDNIGLHYLRITQKGVEYDEEVPVFFEGIFIPKEQKGTVSVNTEHIMP